MSSIQKWLIFSFSMLALAAVYIGLKFTDAVFGLLEIEDPLRNIVPLADIIGLVCGIVAFIVLYKHPRANDFGLEVIKEVKKVTWPTFLETRASTIVVLVMVAIMSVILGIFDWVWATLTNLIYS